MENRTYNETPINFNQTEPLLQFHPWAKTCFNIALVLQWINIVLNLSLNLAVIITIWRYKKRSRLYFLLQNMAIADLATGIIDAFVNGLERSIGAQYVYYWWFGDDFLCKVQRWASSVALCASNFILAATSIDRALVVAKPLLNFKRGYCLQRTLILICWTASAVISSPLLHFSVMKTLQSNYFPDRPQIPVCDVKVNVGGWKLTYILMVVFYVLLPLLVIICSYTILIYAIYKRARTPPNCVRGLDNLKIKLVFNKGLPSSKSRSIKLTLGIVLSFILAWSPFCLGYYMSIYEEFNHPTSMFFVTTFYWNSVANPIVFFVFHRRKVSTTPSSVSLSITARNESNYTHTSTTIMKDSDVTVPLRRKDDT